MVVRALAARPRPAVPLQRHAIQEDPLAPGRRAEVRDRVASDEHQIRPLPGSDLAEIHFAAADARVTNACREQAASANSDKPMTRCRRRFISRTSR
jgi:hypothetical protein